MSSNSNIRQEYANFLSTDAGKDFIEQANKLERAYILQGMHKDAGHDQKAHSISRAEGTIRLRDYVISQTKEPNKASTPYTRKKG